MEREGDSVEEIIKENELLKRNKNNIKKLTQNIKSNLSATYIRKQIKEGKSIKAYVPEEVAEYIEQNKLYRGNV